MATQGHAPLSPTARAHLVKQRARALRFARVGITDLARPDYGDAVTLRRGEIPVFWACGVTPMEAIILAKLDIAITHEPGHMLVTDVTDESLRGGAGAKA